LIERALLRATAAATALALLGTAVCRACIEPRREAQWIVGAGVDGTWLVARISQGNTGVAATTTTSRVAILPRGQPAYESRAATLDATATLARAESEHIEPSARGSTFALGRGDLRVRGELRAPPSACPPPIGDLAAVVYLDVGPSGSENRAHVIDGTGAAVLTAARGATAATALYVFSPGVAIGIDPLASCPAWSVVGDASWSGAATPVLSGDDGRVHATVGPWTIAVKPVGAPLVQDTGVHLLGPERWMAAAAGWRIPQITLQPAMARIDGIDGPRDALLVLRSARLGTRSLERW
jgi:hypothetical protein